MPSNNPILPKKPAEVKATVAKTMAERYETAYMLELNKLPKSMQDKVKAAVGKETTDRTVMEFAKRVALAAEQQI